MSEDVQNKWKRSNSSLVSLTRRFVSLVKSANRGVVDLKLAAKILSVQKRRIYDITNVLEGVGLLSKISQSSYVEWRGRVENNLSQEVEDTLENLQHTSKLLKNEEDELDQHIAYTKQNIKNIRSDHINQSFAYVTRDDFIDCFDDSLILIIQNYEKYQTPYWNWNNQIIKDRLLHVEAEAGSCIDVRLVTTLGESTVNLNAVPGKNNSLPPSRESNMELHDSDTTHAPHTENQMLITRKRRVARETPLHYKIKRAEDIEDQAENERLLAASVIFKDYKQDHSLRRDYREELLESDIPLVQINPPKRDYCFVLRKGEGVFELFDIL